MIPLRHRQIRADCETMGARKTAPEVALTNFEGLTTRTIEGVPMATVHVTCPQCSSRQSDAALEERFWARVDKTAECWNWTGSVSPNGYGRLTIKRTPAYAHRIAFELTNGPVPAGLYVDHQCWNRRCVNPSHLRAVTPAENSQNRSPEHSHSGGMRGVAWHSTKRKWKVGLTVRGRYYWGGYYATRDEAQDACRALAAKIAGGVA